MAQNPPTGVVCSAGAVEACCGLVSLIQLPVTAIGTLKVALKSRTLKVALKSRTVDPPGSAIQTDLVDAIPSSALPAGASRLASTGAASAQRLFKLLASRDGGQAAGGGWGLAAGPEAGPRGGGVAARLRDMPAGRAPRLGGPAAEPGRRRCC